MVGGVAIGGGAPLAIQSMANTKTTDAEATLCQLHRLKEAGCHVARLTVPDEKAARAFGRIRRDSPLPLVADIHFDYKAAIWAAEEGADKIRINPGNIGSDEKGLPQTGDPHPHRRQRRLFGKGHSPEIRRSHGGSSGGERHVPCGKAPPVGF